MPCAGCQKRRDWIAQILKGFYARRRDMNEPTPSELAREREELKALTRQEAIARSGN